MPVVRPMAKCPQISTLGRLLTGLNRRYNHFLRRLLCFSAESRQRCCFSYLVFARWVFRVRPVSFVGRKTRPEKNAMLADTVASIWAVQ